MANTKSALKQARQNLKRRARNRVYRSAARTRVKRARRSTESGDLTLAEAEAAAAIKALDKAAQKGIIHKNNAARRKSRLIRLLRKSQARP